MEKYTFATHMIKMLGLVKLCESSPTIYQNLFSLNISVYFYYYIEHMNK